MLSFKQIRCHSSVSTADCVLQISCLGWRQEEGEAGTSHNIKNATRGILKSIIASAFQTGPSPT